MDKKVINSIRSSIGVVAAIIVARVLGLEFAISAGIVTLITIQRTIRDTLKLLRLRVIGAVISLTVAFYVFRIVGQTLPILLSLIVVVIFATKMLRADESTTVSIVLIGHLYISDKLSFTNLLNEFTILVVGLIIAFILNLFMEDIEKEIKQNQIIIEENFKKIILQMSYRLKNLCHIDNEEIDYEYIRRILKDTKLKSIRYKNNNILEEKNYYLNYTVMRLRQYYQILEMQKHFDNIIFNQEEAEKISAFTLKLSEDFHECNTGEELLKELEHIKNSFRKVSNLCNSIEFENRATLFQYMNDLGRFIDIKYEFSKENL